MFAKLLSSGLEMQGLDSRQRGPIRRALHSLGQVLGRPVKESGRGE